MRGLDQLQRPLQALRHIDPVGAVGSTPGRRRLVKGQGGELRSHFGRVEAAQRVLQQRLKGLAWQLRGLLAQVRPGLWWLRHCRTWS
jgi:hypothetical protein